MSSWGAEQGLNPRQQSLARCVLAAPAGCPSTALEVPCLFEEQRLVVVRLVQFGDQLPSRDKVGLGLESIDESFWQDCYNSRALGSAA